MSAESLIAYFSPLLDNLVCGAVVIEPQTRRILYVNAVAEKMFNDSKDKMVGKNCHRFFCPMEIGKCPFTKAQAAIAPTEGTMVRADGVTFPIMKTVSSIMHDGEEFLLESFSSVEELRTTKETVVVAARENQSKREFISYLSHELRTPINAIVGMTTVAQRSSEVAKLRRYIGMIELSSEHLVSLLNNVLDLQKIEAGKFELILERFNLEKMLLKICYLFAGKINEKNIQFTLRTADNLPRDYHGDELRLSQIIINLLGNALKFTPKNGKISLSVKEMFSRAHKNRLVFTVSDSGCGMSLEALAKLFVPFTQADVKTAARFGGTGLGLALSRDIAQKMNGSIRVDSREGVGSTFTLQVELDEEKSANTLLAADALTLAATMMISETPSDTTASTARNLAAQYDFSALTILVAEDVEVNREVFYELLAPTGLHIDFAENGRCALDKFVAAPDKYQAILMDVQMPVLNGIAATQAIRELKISAAKKIPIIALTGHVFREDLEKCLAAGMNDYLVKPLIETAVLDKLEKIKTGEIA